MKPTLSAYKVQSSKFTAGVGSKARAGLHRHVSSRCMSQSQVGMQMKGLVLANLHLFKKVLGPLDVHVMHREGILLDQVFRLQEHQSKGMHDTSYRAQRA